MRGKAEAAPPHLLGPEVVSHEVLLQLLAGIVDAQLFQTVGGERLKPVHVQQAWQEAETPWGQGRRRRGPRDDRSPG